MTTGAKIVLVVVALIVVAFGVAFGASRYLVSKLDGTGGVSAPLTVFDNEHLGLAFEHPDRYVPTVSHTGNTESEWHVVTLLPAGYVPPEAGEGPPAISVQDIPNPEGLGVRQWVVGDARSNWQLTIDDRASRNITVDGLPAIWYHYSGLYETDSVAVAANGKIYLFSVGWLEPQDQVRTDFNNLLNTVHFK